MLNSADVFAMPSEAELLSIASLESMACARPLMLARAQALPELVDEGVNGYLFERGDVEDAARVINLLADRPERWRAMGAASLRKVQRHSLENTLRSYEKLYLSLVNGPRTRPISKAPSAPLGKRLREAITNILD
jgi:glycosyltransferase involved in cell wall biosynthesis